MVRSFHDDRRPVTPSPRQSLRGRGMPQDAAGDDLAGSPVIGVISQASRFWAYLFLLLLVLFFSVNAESFVSLVTFQNILVAASIPLVAALGQTIVVIGAGIDLSLGYTVGLAPVVAALLLKDFVGGLPLGAALILAMALGLMVVAVAGFVNGTVIAWIGVPAFIMTLGMYGVARGAAFLLSGGPAVAGLPDQVGTFGNGYVVNVFNSQVSFFTAPSGVPGTQVDRYLPNVVLIAAVLVLGVHFIMSQTRFGQHIYAIGGNIEAAKRAGVPVNRRLVQVYVLSALLGGCAGMISLLRFQAGQPTAGEEILLDSLAAVVIGGTSLFGGKGSIPGTVIGALIIAVLQTGLILLNVDPYWQFVAVGVVIIIAVIVDQARAGVLDRVLRRRNAGQARPE